LEIKKKKVVKVYHTPYHTNDDDDDDDDDGTVDIFNVFSYLFKYSSLYYIINCQNYLHI